VYSFFANLILRLVFDIKVLTLSSFYRVYKISLIKAIKEKNKDIITETGFISMIEILIKAIKLEAKIIEVPMLLKSENRKGKSKMKIFKTIVSYLKFLFTNKNN
jgi:dolichol-phosphate mannosyltransferase